MTTEAATYISDLDSTNPAGSQGAGFGDDHLRLLKAVLQSTFPNITGEVTMTEAQINSIPTLAAASDITALEGRTITAGTGLSGGGDLSASRTLSLDTGSSRNVDHSAVSITGTGGLTGGGTIAASRTLSLDTGSSRNVDHNAVSISPGNGLTGGGTLAATRTLSMSGSYTGTFTATGDVRAGSDRRLKTEIAAIENPLEMVRAMAGRRYWRTDLEQHQFGVIAQDHARVQPEAVAEDEQTGYLTVAYGQIVPVLIEAVKALAHRIEMLEQES